MAGKRKELTCKCFVIFPDGRTVPVEELTPEEHAQWQKNMLRRLSENMSDYYTQHPEQYARLPEVREWSSFPALRFAEGHLQAL